MVFGKIDYLNLLPFYVFMKRYAKSTRHHLTLHYKRGVPSKINREFKARRIDAAFISSIAAKGYPQARVGIVARKEVLSVLAIPGEETVLDSDSETSNLLARLLGIRGKILIGDKALRYHLQGHEAIDLAGVWHDRYHLPFVFALLCHHGHARTMRELENAFLRAPVKIPYYLLKQASRRSGIGEREILDYLERISYRIDPKAKKGVKKFWTIAAGYRTRPRTP